METINKILNGLPPEAYMLAVAMLASSPLIQIVKRWLDLQSDKVISWLAMAMYIIGGGLTYLVDANPDSKWLAPAYVAAVGFVSQPYYTHMVKPLWNRAANRITANALNRQVYQDTHSAAVPATGLPGMNPTPVPATPTYLDALTSADDFGRP